jgi:hypothetical protein
MTNVSTVTVIWQGFTGAPGYSHFRFSELVDAAACNAAGAAVRAFFLAQQAVWQTTWSFQVQPAVQQNDMATGKLTSERAMTTTPAVVNGTANITSVYEGGSGYVINWLTNAVHNGHKVRGRTFMVPVTGQSFSNDGTISSATATAAQTAAAALMNDTATELVVWQRFWDDSKPPKQVGGGLAPVTGVLVPDRAAQLRTRRS